MSSIIHISSSLVNLERPATLNWYVPRIQKHIFTKMKILWQSYWTRHKWNKVVWSLQKPICSKRNSKEVTRFKCIKGETKNYKITRKCHLGLSFCHNKYGYNHVEENIDFRGTKDYGIVYNARRPICFSWSLKIFLFA